VQPVLGHSLPSLLHSNGLASLSQTKRIQIGLGCENWDSSETMGEIMTLQNHQKRKAQGSHKSSI
jgi:hypothetical protein